MIKKLTLLLSIVILFSTVIVAQSFTVLYTFDSVKSGTSGLIDPSFLPTATGATFGSFSATGTSANPNADGRFSFTAWPLGSTAWNDVYSSFTGAINTSEYYEVTITPSAGFTLTLSSIAFKSQRSGTGIRTYSVRSSADAYVANLTASISPANAKLSVQTGNVFFVNTDSTITSQSGSTITLSGSNFTNISSAVTFRFYGWNAEAAGGTFSLDNVNFIGTAFPATAITVLPKANSISIYPNPSTNGVFMVNTGESSEKTIVSVYNILGKVIFSKEINSTNKEVSIDLSNEANGSYFVNIKNDKENNTKKITINK